MFNSVYRKLWNHTQVQFPEFSGERVMMMPVLLGSLADLPKQYVQLIHKLYHTMEHRFIGI